MQNFVDLYIHNFKPSSLVCGCNKPQGRWIGFMGFPRVAEKPTKPVFQALLNLTPGHLMLLAQLDQNGV
jgi:hypothetical protein